MAGKAKAFDATNRNTVLVDSHAAAKLAYSELSAGSTATPDVKAIADRWAKVMVSEYTECSLNCREIPLALQRNTRIVPVFYDSSSTNRTGENGLLCSEERHCPGFSLEGTCAVRFPVGH
jgi:hypothetical protein